MGPAETLIDLGADVIVVARSGPKLQALCNRAKHSSGATLYVPALAKNGSSQKPVPGADLATDAPELARWIVDQCPDRRLVLCSLAYLDGERNVRVGVAMDLIVEYVCSKRPDSALSYIVSPATVHTIPEEPSMDAKKRYDGASLWYKTLRSVASGTTSTLQPSYTWEDSAVLPNNGLRIFNGLSSIQGPSYALCKTAQQWRAMVMRCGAFGDAPFLVSANHGPPSRTQSMVSHDKVAVALDGMQSFEPTVAFDVLCSKTLMAALLLYDLNSTDSVANPTKELKHPMSLFEEQAVHGGTWRCPYVMDSIMTASYLLGRVTFQTRGWSPKGSVAPLADTSSPESSPATAQSG